MINKRRFNRKRIRKKCGSLLYMVTKKSTRKVRDGFTTKQTKNMGLAGGVFNALGNKIFKPIIGSIAYSATGNFYNKRKDNPVKGSLIYTLFYCALILLSLKVINIAILWICK